MARPAASARALDDRYSLIELIGQGGIGEVYSGVQVALERPVAIKVMRPELTAVPALVTRFEREARTLSRLRHPNVVTVFDVGRSVNDEHFLVMELLEGETLAARLRDAGAMDLDEAMDIAAQIARGMSACQRVGLVHRDLKPENLFLEETGLVKILDFGVATLRGAPAEAKDEGFVIGTPRYMAPEQAMGWQVDHRADLYAFGCILFEMLTGRPPFVAPRAELYLNFHVNATPPSLEAYRPDVPDGLVALTRSLLAKDPARRPTDWAALTDALRRISAADAVVELDAAAPARKPSEPYRFLRPFSPNSSAIFFGREADTERFQQIWDHPDVPPLLILTGASGVGKTSFLYARITPTLSARGHELITVQSGARPMDAAEAEARRRLARTPMPCPEGAPLSEVLDRLSEALGRLVTVVLDQLEELFTEGNRIDRRDFQAGLTEIIGGGEVGARFVLSLREDYLGPLVRTLHPLSVEQLSRTLALRPLSPEDMLAALAGPTGEGLPVDYQPFWFEAGLAEEIVADLTLDDSGEVAPRIQAVGYRLWEMVRSTEERVITTRHYRQQLGGAQAIVGRVLDEAVESLAPGDRELAKELLRALTHLPGSATSHPAPESTLVGLFEDGKRRAEVLNILESRWRVIHGFTDPRWPEERAYRLAHEALIDRIRDYGMEQCERNRARQVFQHGLTLWLKNGRSEEDLLSEAHFELVTRASQGLVLTGAEQWEYFSACQALRDEGYIEDYTARRQRRLAHMARLGAAAALLIAGFLLGQAPEGFRAVRSAGVRVMATYPGADLSGLHLAGADLSGVHFKNVNLSGADLSGADLSGASLVLADLTGASLERANLTGANLTEATLTGTRLADADLDRATLYGAKLETDLSNADFIGARFNGTTWWGEQPLSGIEHPPPEGAVGLRGSARGMDLTALDFSNMDLHQLDLSESLLTAAIFDGSSLEEATLAGTDLSGASLMNVDLDLAVLVDADLTDADLRGAQLKGADLTGAILLNADLRGADLTGAILSDADLTGADLTGALVDGPEATYSAWATGSQQNTAE